MSAPISQILSDPSLSESRNSPRANASEAFSAGIGDLTRRLAAHDEDAFRQFHASYFDRLYQFLLVVARGQEQEAQEALQETLLRVARRARPFDDEETFWCWLKVVARNVARDRGRKQRRYWILINTISQLWNRDERPPSPGDTDTGLRAILAESLEELSADERHLVEGKYLDGVSMKELSSNTGLTERAVESKLFRLRRQLRERLLAKLKEP